MPKKTFDYLLTLAPLLSQIYISSQKPIVFFVAVSELFSQNATYYGYTKEKQKKNKRKAAKIVLPLDFF